MIIGMLGGMMGPMVEDAAVMAAEKSSSYPSSAMAGMRTDPMAEVSATAAPVTPAKNMLATTLTRARPLRT